MNNLDFIILLNISDGDLSIIIEIDKNQILKDLV